jgi:hypothetical protein
MVQRENEKLAWPKAINGKDGRIKCTKRPQISEKKRKKRSEKEENQKNGEKITAYLP